MEKTKISFSCQKLNPGSFIKWSNCYTHCAVSASEEMRNTKFLSGNLKRGGYLKALDPGSIILK
jgi:hypothetical protein